MLNAQVHPTLVTLAPLVGIALPWKHGVHGLCDRAHLPRPPCEVAPLGDLVTGARSRLCDAASTVVQPREPYANSAAMNRAASTEVDAERSKQRRRASPVDPWDVTDMDVLSRLNDEGYASFANRSSPELNTTQQTFVRIVGQGQHAQHAQARIVGS